MLVLRNITWIIQNCETPDWVRAADTCDTCCDAVPATKRAHHKRDVAGVLTVVAEEDNCDCEYAGDLIQEDGWYCQRPVVLVRRNNAFVVGDGHHRLAWALANNLTCVPVWETSDWDEASSSQIGRNLADAPDSYIQVQDLCGPDRQLSFAGIEA